MLTGDGQWEGFVDPQIFVFDVSDELVSFFVLLQLRSLLQQRFLDLLEFLLDHDAFGLDFLLLFRLDGLETLRLGLQLLHLRLLDDHLRLDRLLLRHQPVHRRQILEEGSWDVVEVLLLEYYCCWNVVVDVEMLLLLLMLECCCYWKNDVAGKLMFFKGIGPVRLLKLLLLLFMLLK